MITGEHMIFSPPAVAPFLPAASPNLPQIPRQPKSIIAGHFSLGTCSGHESAWGFAPNLPIALPRLGAKMHFDAHWPGGWDRTRDLLHVAPGVLHP